MAHKIRFLIAYGVLLLCTGEVATRVFFALPMVAGDLIADEELTWRRNWVRRHARGREIYYQFDVYDSTLGWASRPGLRDEQVFDGEILNTNSRGLRGTEEFDYEPGQRRPRIVVLGDSFTFGDEVSDQETYSHYLQELLPGAEIINMGVHGYGHDQMLILLQDEGVKYRPDIVLLGFIGLDMGRNLLDFRDYAKPRFVMEEDGTLLRRGIPVPPPTAILRWDWMRPRVLDAAAFVRYRLDVALGREDRRAEAITTRILEEFVRTTEAIGAEAVLVYLPEGRHIAQPVTETPAEAFMMGFVQGHAGARGLSTYPAFKQAVAGGSVFETRGHWGPNGHETVAHSIAEYLQAEGLIEPGSLVTNSEALGA